jgi:outer membrane immunogenic protein
MKKLFLASVALVALNAGGSALAADMPVKARRAPPPPPVYSWTGCYIGVNGGYGWHQQRHTNDLNIVDLSDPVFIFFPTQTLSADGGFGGGQIGCNYQTGIVVWGVEADIQGSGIRDSFGPRLFTQPVGSLSVTASEKLKWFGTIRGRVGLAADRALFYVTGGAAFAKTQYNLFAVEPEEGGNVTLNGDTSRSGYAVGGGIEVAFFGGWTAKAEYQYLNFGSIGPLNATAVDRFGVPLDTTVTTNAFRNDYHTIRFGLNYRFDWGKAPVAVMAKY